jgi:hypothetical protein
MRKNDMGKNDMGKNDMRKKPQMRADYGMQRSAYSAPKRKRGPQCDRAAQY